MAKNSEKVSSLTQASLITRQAGRPVSGRGPEHPPAGGVAPLTRLAPAALPHLPPKVWRIFTETPEPMR